MAVADQVVRLDLRRRADRARFLDLPFELASAHANWHPGVRLYADALLHPTRNPWWRERTAAFHIVVRAGRVVARGGVIAPGVVPQRPHAATLVMPDFVDDAAAVRALVDALAAQARAFGATEIIGPMNPDIHHDIGIQVSGYEHRNAVFMGYQPPYYERHFSALGFERLADFHAWILEPASDVADPRLEALVRRVERGGRLHIRAADPQRFDAELPVFHALYSGSFADHWGFVPPTREEFDFIAGDLRHILRRGMALVAEWNGRPAGFVLSVPDLHAIVPKHARGRLTPSVIARTCWRWRSMTDARIMIAGVLPAYRRFGIHLPLFHRIRANLTGLGFRRGEISWVLQDNRPMQRALQLLGARRTKTYRLYAKRLAP